MNDITRFLEAHDRNYRFALAEIKKGRKESHWMWYIFPQIQGLGRSYTANYYAIKDLEEAKLYMEHEVLKSHMMEICAVLLDLESDNASYIFGFPDDRKLCSSMTLFSISNPEYKIFQKVLDKFFHGEKDSNTIRIVEG